MRKDLSATGTLHRLAGLQPGAGGRALTCATCLLAAVVAGLEAPELPPVLIFLAASTIAATLAGWQIGAAVALGAAAAWWLVFHPPGPGLPELAGFAGLAALDLALVAALHDAVGRLRAHQNEFCARIAAERVMLTELDHRLSNTMQSIASLLGRQARAAASPETKLALNEAVGRVAIFARVHRRVSQPGADIGGFLDALCHDLITAFGASHVRLSVACDPVELDPRAAETVALIVAELLTNAVKHAFPAGTPGRIAVSLRRVGAHCVLEVRDNGVGMEEPSASRSEGSLGLTVVRSLAGRLGGTVSWAGAGSTVVTVEFTA